MTDDNFAKDILAGLKAEPKHLSFKYFYDEIGDKLFTQITQLEEYYLTSSETEILSKQGKEILDSLQFGTEAFDIVELGAGDGTKVVKLLEQLDHDRDVRFMPVDISENALSTLHGHVSESLPWLKIETINAEYFGALSSIGGDRPRLVLFLGSNIGNMYDMDAQEFISALSDVLNPGDKVLLGVDLMKSKEVILPAYNDSQGVTREFNLNLLSRINKELDADFDLSKFEHRPEYNELSGVTESYLVSTEKQKVTIGSLDETIDFEEGEAMQTEQSIKYDQRRLDFILKESALSVTAVFKDSRDYFADILLTKNESN